MSAAGMRTVRMSWGRLPFAPPAREVALQSRSAPLTLDPAMSWLPYGNGRSYGDSCLNAGAATRAARKAPSKQRGR